MSTGCNHGPRSDPFGGGPSGKHALNAGGLRLGRPPAGSSADGYAPTSPDTLRGWRLGERWRTLEVIYKQYPVCDTNQGPIVLAATIRRRLADSDERIATVRCFLSPADRSYPGTLNRGPFTDRSATLMSAPYCVAIGLKYGTATVAGLREYDDPELLDDRADRDIADERLGALSSRLEILIAGAVLGSGTGDSAAFLRRPESS